MITPAQRSRCRDIHSQLAQVKHDHRSEDGRTIRPVIEIIGYPASPPGGR
jgi:hypothetical protein